jgi:hypothetical protein
MGIDEPSHQAQSLDSEAAWEAAQKQADQTGGIAVDFNPYDEETGCGSRVSQHSC